MATGRFISYLRVSTQQQGKSGLGLEAQREAVAVYLNGGRWKLVEEVVEVESGKRSDRPQLARALSLCRIHGATDSDTTRWGDKIVFRVCDQAAGGKMFCQIDFEKDGRAVLSFAAVPERFNELIEMDGVIPTPYRARLHWVKLTRWDAIGESVLKGLLRDAIERTFAKLPKRTRDLLTRGGSKSK